MSPPVSLRFVRAFGWLVGLMDAATGVALVAAPGFTLARMGVPVPGAEALGFVRYVGVFVGAVGAAYLWALLAGGVARLRTVLEVTLIARAGVGLLTGIAVGLGAFDRGWLIVTATDLGCVALQAWMLRKGLDERG